MTIQLTELDNGLKIVTDSFSAVETVSCGIWVGVGARFETLEMNGVSHFLEHMAFKGTTTRSAFQIAKEIEAVGGYLNAYTARESTAYYARVLKADAPLAIDILSDILINSTFDPNEFKREQGVILQEIGQANDTPDDIIFDYYQETCYPNHPMGWPILGREAIIQSLTPNCVKNYMQDMYCPSRMIVAASGNIEHSALVNLIKNNFGNLQSKNKTDVLKAHYSGGEFRLEKDLEQAHIVLGFEGVPFENPDYYAYLIYATIMGGGMSSRLFQEIREKRGLVYTISAYHSSYSDSGQFQIYAGTGENEVKELFPVMIEELKKVTKKIADDELQRAKAQIKAGLLMGMENTSYRCERLANQLLIYGKTLNLNDIIAKIDSVTTYQVMDVALKLIKKPMSVASLGPISYVPKYAEIQQGL